MRNCNRNLAEAGIDIEFVQDKATKAEFPPEDQIGIKIHAETQKRGLVSRLRGDVFCLAPPVVITREQLDRVIAIMADSVKAILG